MTDEIYRTFVRDLSDFYGKKDIGAGFIAECEEELKDVPNRNARAFFKYIVRKCDYFPRLTELSRLKADFIDKSERQTAWNVPSEHCPYCLGAGLIPYLKTVRGLGYKPQYFAACVCAKGREFYHAPVLGIDEVYGGKTNELLAFLAEKSGKSGSVDENKRSFLDSVTKWGAKSEAFKGAGERAI